MDPIEEINYAGNDYICNAKVNSTFVKLIAKTALGQVWCIAMNKANAIALAFSVCSPEKQILTRE